MKWYKMFADGKGGFEIFQWGLEYDAYQVAIKVVPGSFILVTKQKVWQKGNACPKHQIYLSSLLQSTLWNL